MAVSAGGGGGLRGADRSLRLAVGLLVKTLLHNLGALRTQPAFPKLWDATLQVRAPPATLHPRTLEQTLDHPCGTASRG